MYKILINETPLLLMDAAAATEYFPGDNKKLIGRYTGKTKNILNYADMMEKTQRYDAVILYASDYENLVKDFQSLYKIIEAAGGVVTNSQNETLLIYRRDFWDLPKGKIDPGETPEVAAVREVQEETGVQNIILGDFIQHSWHTYRTSKGKRILKKTYWYKMQTTDTDLIPQTEEDIEQAIWQNAEDFLASKQKVYKSIQEVLESSLQKEV